MVRAELDGAFQNCDDFPAPLCGGHERGEIGVSQHERVARMGMQHLVCVSTTESFTGSKTAISQVTGLLVSQIRYTTSPFPVIDFYL
jgi:hypothetical protein